MVTSASKDVFVSTYVGKRIQLLKLYVNTKNIQFEALCYEICEDAGVTMQVRNGLPAQSYFCAFAQIHAKFSPALFLTIYYVLFQQVYT